MIKRYIQSLLRFFSRSNPSELTIDDHGFCDYCGGTGTDFNDDLCVMCCGSGFDDSNNDE